MPKRKIYRRRRRDRFAVASQKRSPLRTALSLLAFLSVLLAALLIFLSFSGTPIPSWVPWLGEEEEVISIAELRFVVWDDGSESNQRLQTLVDGYNEAVPTAHVTLELLDEYETSLPAAFEGDTPPDIFLIDTFRLPDFVDNSAIAPIEPQLAKIREPIQLDDFYPALIDAFSVDGTLYCLPRDGSTLALFYNKTLFDDAEIAYPSANWTWTELTTAIQTISETTNDFYTTYGMATSLDFSRWVPFLFQAGGSVVAPDGSQMALNNATATAALDFYLDPVLDGIAATPTELNSGWGGEALGKGRAGMTIEGNWSVPYFAEEFSTLNYGIAPLPAGTAGRATMLFSSCYAVSTRTAESDAAFAFVAYLTSRESMQSWTAGRHLLPARRSVAQPWLAENPQMQPFVDGLDYAQPWRFEADFQEVVDAVNSSMQQVVDAEVDTEELLRVAEVIGNEVLAR